jgi:hypothetical protein
VTKITISIVDILVPAEFRLPSWGVTVFEFEMSGVVFGSLGMVISELVSIGLDVDLCIDVVPL